MEKENRWINTLTEYHCMLKAPTRSILEHFYLKKKSLCKFCRNIRVRAFFLHLLQKPTTNFFLKNYQFPKDWQVGALHVDYLYIDKLEYEKHLLCDTQKMKTYWKVSVINFWENVHVSHNSDDKHQPIKVITF